MSDLLASLLRFALAWSGYPVPSTLPVVEVVQLHEMPCPCQGAYVYGRSDEGDGTRATGAARLMLRDDVDLSTVYGQSILLHELVHVLQAQEGAVSWGSHRWHAREREAHRIQFGFIKAAGLTYLDDVFSSLVDLTEFASESQAPGHGSGGNPNRNGLLSEALSAPFE